MIDFNEVRMLGESFTLAKYGSSQQTESPTVGAQLTQNRARIGSLLLTAVIPLLACGASAASAAQTPSQQQAGNGSEGGVADLASASRNFAMAKLLAGEGQFEAAKERFDLAVAAEPEAAVLRIEYAEFLFRFRRIEEAKEQIAEAKRLAPTEVAGLRSYGQIFLSSAEPSAEDVENAVQALETLRDTDPSDLMGMITLAQAYEGTNRIGDAADVVGELVSYHTANDRLKRYWIQLLKRSGRNSEANEVLREVVRLEQESIEARLELAEGESADGNFSAAIELLTQVREVQDSEQVIRRLAQAHLRRSRSPGLTESQRDEDLAKARALASELGEDEGKGLEARVLGLSGETAAAIALLGDLPADSEEHVPNLVLLAQLLESSGQIDEAAASLERAADVVPDAERLGIERERALLFFRNQKWRRAVEAVDELVGDSSPQRFPTLRAMRIQALVQLKEFDQALDILKREGGKSPEPENLMSRAEVLADQGKAKQARAMMDRIDESDPSIEQRKANVLIALGDFEAATAIVAELVGEPTFESLFTAGQFLSRDGLFDRAQQYLERALETEEAQADESRRADVHFYLGQALERQGKLSDAAVSFKKVLEVRSDDPLALNYLGYMYADANRNLDEAVELIERALSVEPDNGAYHDSLGWAQYRLGRYDDAATSLERAAELSPGNATIFDHLGDTYRALERIEDAREAYESALSHASGEEAERVREKIRSLRSTRGSQ